MQQTETISTINQMVDLEMLQMSKDGSVRTSERFHNLFVGYVEDESDMDETLEGSIKRSFILSALEFSNLTEKNLEKYFHVFLAMNPTLKELIDQ